MKWRRIFQFAGLFGINGYYPGFRDAAIYQGQAKQICAPILNCYACPGALMACPIGSFQHFVIVNQSIPWLIVGFFGLIGMAVGRMMCGWVCPFGFFQDLLYKFRSFKFGIPKAVTYFKYVVLVGVVFVITHYFQEPWFSKLCPAGLFEAGMPFTFLSEDIRSMIKYMFWIKLGILMIFFTLSVTSKRPFCRTVCPVGTIYSFFNNYSFYQMVVDEACCTGCDRCKKVCPMDIRIYENAYSVDCIRCLECTRCACVSYKTIFHRLPALQPALEEEWAS
jgi:ferredoxin-type protein NapH